MKLYRRETVAPDVYRAAAARLHGALDEFQLGALYDYTEYGYKPLNAKLNAGEALNAHERMQVRLLDEIIAQHSAGKRRTLYRGAKQIYAPVTEGQVCPFPAYTSATSDPHKVVPFITAEQPIVFEITTSAGCGISHLREEFEYLLPRNQQFFVRSVTPGVQWHAEYGESGYYKAVSNATVIELVEIEE